MNIIIHGKEYELASTLRVAYEMQKQNNHKAYSEIFKGLGDMKIEDQIGLLYCAFKVANPDDAKTFTAQMFTEYYLDNYTLKDIMTQLKAVIQGITGESDDDIEKVAPEDSQGN